MKLEADHPSPPGSKKSSGEARPAEGAPPVPRSIFHLAAAFILGIAIGTPIASFCPPVVLVTSGAILLGLHCVLVFCKSSKLRPFFLPLVLFFCLGFLADRSAAPHSPSHPRLEPFLGKSSSLFMAHVVHPPDFTPQRVRLPLCLEKVITEEEEIPLNVCVLASMERDRFTPGQVAAGDRMLVFLHLKRFHNFNNPGGFDYVRHQAEQGFYGQAFISTGRTILKLAAPSLFSRHAADRVMQSVDRFRQESLQWVTRHLSPDTAAFHAALILGYQRLVSPEWFEHLARAGVTHLLSIGGLHLGLVTFFVFRIFSAAIRFFRPTLLRSRSDRRMALWPALLAAGTYGAIAGFTSPPIWRSMLMLTVCTLAAHRYRNPDPLSVLGLSALAILIMDPNALGHISFQLTFVCMLAIFTLYPKFERFRLGRLHPVFAPGSWPGSLLRPFEEAFWMSVAVNLLVLPLTVYYFHGLSLSGVAANVVLVPLVGFLVLPCSLASVALFAVHEHLGTPVLYLAGRLLQVTQDAILWFGKFSWSYFWVGKPAPISLAFCYALLAVLLFIGPLKRKLLAVAGLAVCACGPLLMSSHLVAPSPAGGDLMVHVLDVGQGSSTLVQFPTGETMLVDGGGFPNDSFDIGRAVVAPFLWATGIRKLDHVVLSHDHPDHSRGLNFILSHFRVGCFWETGITAEHSSWVHPADIARKRGIPIRNLMDGPPQLTVGPSQVRFLHPSETYLREEWDGKDLNDVSAVVQIDYRETHCIIPGDINRSLEEKIFQAGILRGPVFLVGAHHGSGRSNGPYLLDRLKPAAVAFSCGFENPFHFPALTVLDNCRNRGIPVFRTDLNGTIRAASDGRKWRIHPFLETR